MFAFCLSGEWYSSRSTHKSHLSTSKFHAQLFYVLKLPPCLHPCNWNISSLCAFMQIHLCTKRHHNLKKKGTCVLLDVIMGSFSFRINSHFFFLFFSRMEIHLLVLSNIQILALKKEWKQKQGFFLWIGNTILNVGLIGTNSSARIEV